MYYAIQIEVILNKIVVIFCTNIQQNNMVKLFIYFKSFIINFSCVTFKIQTISIKQLIFLQKHNYKYLF